jgi:hypothetical protein
MGYYRAGGSVPLDNDFFKTVENASRGTRAFQGIQGGAYSAAPAGFFSGAGGARPGGGLADDEPRARGPRMNVANPQAMRRSMRRIQSFAKAAQKMISFPTHHHHKHKAHPFARRKRK